MFLAKMALSAAAVAVLGLVGVAGGPVFGADKSWEMFNSWLNNLLTTIPTKIRPQKITPIQDSELQKVFPANRFYGVHYANWPRPPASSDVPAELSRNTAVSVQRGESIEPIRDEEALRAFLARTLPEVHGEAQASDAVIAALRLAETIAKAGSSSFEEPKVSVVRQGETIVATGQASAQAPARGEVAVNLEFGADGKIKPDAIRIVDRSRPGPS